MNERSRRKQLRAQYKQTRPEAGVYRIFNSRNNRGILGSATDLTSIRNRLAFAKSTGTSSVLDRRLGKDIREFGIEALSLEVLEILEVKPETDRAEILEDLSILEELWREKLNQSLLY